MPAWETHNVHNASSDAKVYTGTSVLSSRFDAAKLAKTMPATASPATPSITKAFVELAVSAMKLKYFAAGLLWGVSDLETSLA